MGKERRDGGTVKIPEGKTKSREKAIPTEQYRALESPSIPMAAFQNCCGQCLLCASISPFSIGKGLGMVRTQSVSV